ncbi:hypothetical protein CDAR_212091 [Caerostris darwini]|uniref:Uncharacterized protein n=1 Tax=Caerostris darwini TaxID=1538125 RepID=A0AAV4NT62_9ARAC|nr:hypothetical protein CDAR_212091 [Caerostris darwini]
MGLSQGNVRIEREISRQLRDSIPCVKSRTSSHCARHETPDTIVKRNTCQTLSKKHPQGARVSARVLSCRSFYDLLNKTESGLSYSTAAIFPNYAT